MAFRTDLVANQRFNADATDINMFNPAANTRCILRTIHIMNQQLTQVTVKVHYTKSPTGAMTLRTVVLGAAGHDIFDLYAVMKAPDTLFGSVTGIVPGGTNAVFIRVTGQILDP